MSQQKISMRSLPLRLRRYRPGAFARMHGPGSGMVSASGVAALFDQHRFMGSFAYAAHISGKAPLKPPADEEDLEWGKRLEAPLLEWLGRDRPEWTIRRLNAYAVHPDIPRLYASPDAVAWRPDRATPGVLELKTVRAKIFQDQWLAAGDVEDGETILPMDVRLQHQTQLACCGAEWGAIVVLVHGFDFQPLVFETEPMPAAITRIEAKVRDTLAMIDRGELPSPDPSESALAALRQLYEPRPGVTVHAPDVYQATRMLETWLGAKEAAKAAAEIETRAKAYFAGLAGDASRVVVGNVGEVRLKSVTVNHKAQPERTSHQRRIEPRLSESNA